jgi:hypothetical protein
MNFHSKTHPWIKEITNDLLRLYMHIENCTVSELTLAKLTPWFKQQSKKSPKQLLTFATENDAPIGHCNHTATEQCPTCHKVIKNKGLLALHMQRAHNITDIHKRLVTSPQCPKCSKMLKSDQHCWTHFRTHCLPQLTEVELQLMFASAAPVASGGHSSSGRPPSGRGPPVHTTAHSPNIPKSNLPFLFAVQRIQQLQT